MSTPPDQLRIAIGIATLGRAAILKDTLGDLTHQTRPPDRIIVSCVSKTDIIGLDSSPAVEVLMGPAGSAHQRNTILDAIGDCDIVLFLDDDFLMAPDYIKTTLAVFATDQNVVVTCGRVLVDGVNGPGISMAEGRQALIDGLNAQDGGGGQLRNDPTTTPTFNGYGCNMAVRLSTARAHGIRFDERLLLYAWYEDIDFSRRIGRHGKVVQIEDALGVHLGVKIGRTTGCRLGYSQIANPLYLWRKGSYPLYHAVRSISRHLVVNGVRSLRPEPWIDRRGRLLGNALALFDVVRGRVKPERIIDL